MLRKPFVIAEVGNNHEGNFEIAKKLIFEASKAKVDAIKFQTFKVENFISLKEKKKFKKLKKFQLSKDEFYKLYLIAKKKKLKFISTPLDIQSAQFLGRFVDYFKIASGDNDYYELMETVFKFKKPTIISTGLLKEREIGKLVNFVKKKKFKLKNLTLLHCVSNYPAKFKDLNLNFITKLKSKYGNKIKIGYSDHSVGLAAPLCSFMLGSEVIEKHFTLDNNFSKFRDHELSLNPKDMTHLIKLINEILESQGKKKKIITKNENLNYYQMRRSYYLKNNLAKNQSITANDLVFKRPRINKSITNFYLINKKKPKNDLLKDNVIFVNQLKK